MALLSFVEKYYAEKIALVDDQETLSYKELLFQSEKLAVALKEEFPLKSGQKVGFLCKNHGSLVKSIFAVSQLGADVYLLNAEFSRDQISNLLEQNDFALLIYDLEWDTYFMETSYRGAKLLSYHDKLPAINNILKTNEMMEQELKREHKQKLKQKEKPNHKPKHKLNRKPIKKLKRRLARSSFSKVILLTGGTAGRSKEAAHKPSIFNYLNPFLALLTRLNLINYQTAYVATPIYHGYGVSLLLLFVAMGKKVVITRRFEAEKACSLIREHKVEVISVVPLMLKKMLRYNVDDLKSLTRILSGGAELHPKLVKETSYHLGDVLCNLYGSSEAGLNIIATPADLQYSALTIGKKINGVQLKVLDDRQVEVKDGGIGQFYVNNRWSMKNRNNSWIGTGDLGYRDENGYYFLRGRVDDMIVSAGENVYPMELEQILKQHPQIEDAAVIGIKDEDFGQRLNAFVLLANNATLTKEELLEWLNTKVARFQIPKELVFLNELPYTTIGKLDRKQLR